MTGPPRHIHNMRAASQFECSRLEQAEGTHAIEQRIERAAVSSRAKWTHARLRAPSAVGAVPFIT